MRLYNIIKYLESTIETVSEFIGFIYKYIDETDFIF